MSWIAFSEILVSNDGTLIFKPKQITVIPSHAFFHCHKLQNILFNGIIKEIHEFAFASCISLSSIDLPSSLSYIGRSAFEYAESLKGDLIIAENVTLIAPYAFSSCGFNGSLIFENLNFDLINESLFQNCQSLQYISFPINLKSIMNNAFSFCHSLKQLILPDSLEYIGANAFERLLNIHGDLIIPKNVIQILSYAFSSSSFNGTLNFTSSNLFIIEMHSFSYCSMIKNIIFPPKLKSIQRNAFENCLSLENLILPNSLEYIGESAFSKCKGIQGDLRIPSNVAEIQQSAFFECTFNSTLFIESDFYHDIHPYTFAFCSKLKKVEFSFLIDFIRKFTL
jgi:hypothetical protein